MAVKTTAASKKKRGPFTMMSPSLSADTPLGFGLALAKQRIRCISPPRFSDHDPAASGKAGSIPWWLHP
jgi:hypothetical protein